MQKINKDKKYSKLAAESLYLLSFCLYLSTGAVFSADNTDIDKISSDKTIDQAQSTTNNSDINNNLAKLEKKLFQHTYEKDSTEDRLNRLEKFIFGQGGTGSNDERLAALLTAVPNADTVANDKIDNSSESASNTSDRKNSANNSAKDNEDTVSDQSKYPAVTAMETKQFGKDYSDQPIKDRLARLEKKILGKVSTSDDLSDRVDNLKKATGVDIAEKSSSLSDWLEDNDEMLKQRQSMIPGNTFNPDVYQDMQKPYGPTGYPFASPYFPDQPALGQPVSIKSFGLSQQVTALEHEIFHKAYNHDPLPARLNRLETTVFPDRKPAVEVPLPQRVDDLLAKVPISQKELKNLAIENGIDTSGGFGQSAESGIPTNSPTTPGKPQTSLGKLMNSIGSMLGGGMTGSFPMSGGNYVVDPKTGMLLDPTTGTVINPNTGTVYGGSSIPPSYATPYSAYPYSGYGMGGMGMGGFGLSPFGSISPYSMGPGFGYGSGGMGMGFGFR